MIKSCIFDLDGTLLYTLDTITYYINLTFAKHGINPLSTEEVRIIVGKGARDLISSSLRLRNEYRSDEFFENIFAEYKAEYEKNPTHLTVPYDGVPELIGELRRRGIKLGVLSNKPHDATLPIVEHFFSEGFDLVFGAVNGYPLKPDPTRLIQMTSDFDIDISELLYIGDMISDIKTGKNANAGAVGAVLWGYQTKEELLCSGADAFFEKPSDIVEALI